ncbi:MAG: hypothetical protein QXS29_06035 [Nitrososphaeria archaeon]
MKDKIISEEEYINLISEVLEDLKSLAIKTFRENSTLINDMVTLHHLIHNFKEEFKRLEWLSDACFYYALSIFFTSIGYYNVVCFTLRHGLEIVDKNTRSKKMDEVEKILYNKLYNLLSEVVHGRVEVSLEDIRDFAFVTSYLYIYMIDKYNPHLLNHLINKGFEYDEAIQWLTDEVAMIFEKMETYKD